MSGQTVNTLESAIVHNAANYDDLPYVSYPVPSTHPGRLAAVAKIFNLSTPSVTAARVLELGCASGGNLIPLAARHSNAYFLGVDFSGRQIEEGARRIAGLRLANVRLRQQSLTDLRPEDGTFDYIICHGVYSWVPAPVRDAILRIAHENLAPTGVAFISYNVLPGWRVRQTLRDAIAIHGASHESLHARVVQARELIAFLEQYTPSESVWGRICRDEAAKLKGLNDSYIAHEYLEDCNEPCSFTEFMENAVSHRLAYLGEAELPSMLPENWNPSAAPFLRALPGDQQIHLEQHIDICTSRTFRQTLLVHRERESECALVPSAIEGLHLSARADFAFAREENGQAVFMDGTGAHCSIGDAAMRRALEILIARLPGSSSLDDLITALETEGAPADAQTRATLADCLFNMTFANILSPSTEPTRAATSLTQKPVACPLLRGDAAANIFSSANLRHDWIALGVMARTLIPLLDGTNDREALITAATAAVAAGRISSQPGGTTVTDPAAVTDYTSEHVDRFLADFLRNACLIA
jgi:methyltransferase-like protein/2-polyprenyl-3-methyl-5-hydroxy-6-metoxy-1,4-benzoquinol methylase